MPNEVQCQSTVRGTPEGMALGCVPLIRKPWTCDAEISVTIHHTQLSRLA